MRKLVITLLVTLAAFTFIRDYHSPQVSAATQRAEIRSALIP